MRGPQTGAIPEDSFRAEGHACAITLPGIKDSEAAVVFTADAALRRYLAAQGIENADARADERLNPP